MLRVYETGNFFFFFEEKGIKSKALRAFNNEGIFFLLYMDY